MVAEWLSDWRGRLSKASARVGACAARAQHPRAQQACSKQARAGRTGLLQAGSCLRCQQTLPSEFRVSFISQVNVALASAVSVAIVHEKQGQDGIEEALTFCGTVGCTLPDLPSALRLRLSSSATPASGAKPAPRDERKEKKEKKSKKAKK